MAAWIRFAGALRLLIQSADLPFADARGSATRGSTPGYLDDPEPYRNVCGPPQSCGMAYVERWMRELASQQNVAVKISGIVMIDHQ